MVRRIAQPYLPLMPLQRQLQEAAVAAARLTGTFRRALLTSLLRVLPGHLRLHGLAPRLGATPQRQQLAEVVELVLACCMHWGLQQRLQHQQRLQTPQPPSARARPLSSPACPPFPLT